ncbi:hypothetical protein, partial [Sphingomonas sp. RB1R13]|uniref:hypothetical protein n=1 Tax=Sphingomonas sp. RB1R13 TaxID=3096159 RepID=UPI002FCA0F36
MVRSSVPRVPAARGRRRAHSLLTVAIPLVAFLPSQSSAQAIAPNPSAAVLRAPSYSSEAVPNAIGPAIQRNCRSRGGEATGCASLARNAGGVGQGYGISR